MSGLMHKAKDAMEGHHASTATADEEHLPGNFVSVPGGSYDAGPGVKNKDNDDPPKIVSDPHDTSKGVSSDAVPKSHGVGSVADDDAGKGSGMPSNDPATGTEASSKNKKDNYDPEDVERKDGGRGEAVAPATSEGPEKVFDK